MSERIFEESRTTHVNSVTILKVRSETYLN